LTNETASNKKLCTAKETITRMKRQCKEWQKTVVSCSSNGRLISRIYKELKKIKHKKSKLSNQQVDK
jgi:hypothetical protein